MFENQDINKNHKLIFLIGYMGSGKSTLGKKLADNINYDFIDSDLWIEKEQEMSI
ncbi:MAG: shikimate kinase, partial [Bacteroidetes bacterium]|nr:shikimate kinase [Bacteroidota bacterium]